MRGCYTLALPLLSALRIGFGLGALDAAPQAVIPRAALSIRDLVACGTLPCAGGEVGRSISEPLPCRRETEWEREGLEHVS
jgi:hypothetical protein